MLRSRISRRRRCSSPSDLLATGGGVRGPLHPERLGFFYEALGGFLRLHLLCFAPSLARLFVALAIGPGPAGEVFSVTDSHVVSVLVSGLRLAASVALFLRGSFRTIDAVTRGFGNYQEYGPLFCLSWAQG